MSKAMYHGFMMLFCLILYVPTSWSAPAWAADILLILALFEASMMFWYARKEWDKGLTPGTIVLSLGDWLCPHCLRDDNRVILTARNSQEMRDIRYYHMRDHHPEILDKELFG